MTYQETLDYLFNALPMYQRIGAAAYKTDLTNTIALCEHLGNPHTNFKSIHIAGTNGKGSTSHSLAAVLQSAGYKVGLYTSPHLKSFTERIKINGQDIPEDEVVTFVEENKTFLEELQPSFFEMTVGMAFKHFADHQVDIAVVEVGMGGRLDSTNIISPLASVITNIGMDHTQFLGDTLAKIAAEKGGIIKPNTPVVISERNPETEPVFIRIAAEKNAPIIFAEDNFQVKMGEGISNGNREYSAKDRTYHLDLAGAYQQKNLAGVLQAIEILRQKGFEIKPEDVEKGLANVTSLTGLKGRWQKLNDKPLTYCDTGHNKEAFQYILQQIQEQDFERLHFVLGVVNDKDVQSLLKLFPKDAQYTFCQPEIPRAMPAEDLAELARLAGIEGSIVRDVNEAIRATLKKAGENDFIFIGGSTFVVAEIENL
jgi:dihydrofolate synthase / folylpolyglutamate synthase